MSNNRVIALQASCCVNPAEAQREFRALTDALHAAGIGVLLDVVFRFDLASVFACAPDGSIMTDPPLPWAIEFSRALECSGRRTTLWREPSRNRMQRATIARAHVALSFSRLGGNCSRRECQ